MKDFFNKKDISDIPQELEWENMEKGIFEKMEAIQKAESVKNKKVLYKRRLLLLVLFLGLFFLGLTFFFRNTNFYGTEQTSQGSQEKFKDNELPTRDGIKKIDDKPVNEAVASDKDQNNDNSPTHFGPSVVNTPLKGTAKNRPKQASVTPVADTTNEEDASFNKHAQRHKVSTQLPYSQGQANGATAATLDKMPQGKDSPRGTLEETIPQNGANAALDSALDIPAPFLPERFKAEALSKNVPLVPSKIIGKTEKPNSTSGKTKSTLAALWPAEKQASLDRSGAIEAGQQIILEGGITVWDKGTAQSLPNEKSYENPLLSFQIQANYARGIKDNFFFMTGLHYQQLESRFYYSTTIPDYVVTLRDTLVQVRNNMITGEQENVYGDVQQTVEANRKVVHYNTSRLFKTSLAAGRSWYFKGMQADAYLGAALNALTFNSGRTLVNDTLRDYSGWRTSVIENRFGVEAFAGARIHYSLYPKVALTGGVQVQKSLKNWSTSGNTRLYPLSVGILFGISYNLGNP